MDLHVHSAHRQRKSLGCEHKKRVEKRWRITRADIRPGVYGPLQLIISNYYFLNSRTFYIYLQMGLFSRLTVNSRDPDGSRVKECLILHTQSFPSTGMSEVIQETLAHLQVSAQTSMKSQFESVSHFCFSI